MKIAFGGDLFLGGDLNGKSAVDAIHHADFVNADYRVVNLEQPISDNDILENKCTLFTGSYAIDQLRQLKIDVVNLANNHIQDKGLPGINETVQHLERNNIGHFGAGENNSAARKPYYITEEIALLGYCEFAKPYLRQITLAGENCPGVAPLRYEVISDDLSRLPENVKAVLYFHWGKEHVWLPPYADIALAKRLLADDRVLLIIGTHAHRMQGYIEHNGKRAYMCLGNFLFPNFYIKPPTQIYYPEGPQYDCDVTRQYHDVYKITYKKWRHVNRVSIFLFYDTINNITDHQFVYQQDHCPNIVEISGKRIILLKTFIKLLSCFYKLPRYLYVPIETISSHVINVIWHINILLFKINQLGIFESLKKGWFKILKGSQINEN
ncbi:MAG: CapA family protein [Smithellaceae bacterium]|nr:CapA family protein [Smithellaceae bacterium]